MQVSGTPRRKGAMRRSDIPPHVLRALNGGREETITLVEWLAIDVSALLRAVLPDVGLQAAQEELGEVANKLTGEGVTKRLRGIGAALHTASRKFSESGRIYEALATQRSDMVRAWAAFMLTADEALPLPTRLEATRRFAAYHSVAVRECAWDSMRPYITANLDECLTLLEGWVRDSNPNVRRCAVEGTRPRGVWTSHIVALKQEPEMGLGLLEPLRSDPSDYVRRSVANWLNDASKSKPDWVEVVCRGWNEESPTVETASIIKRALRTLRKIGASSGS